MVGEELEKFNRFLKPPRPRGTDPGDVADRCLKRKSINISAQLAAREPICLPTMTTTSSREVSLD